MSQLKENIAGFKNFFNHLMVNFGEKAKIKKAGNLNSGHSYLITTVNDVDYYFIVFKRKLLHNLIKLTILYRNLR